MEAPGFFPNNNYCSTRTAANSHSDFVIEDLLDFSHEDIVMDDAATFTDSSTVTVVDSCHSSDTQFNPHHHNPSHHAFPVADPHFSGGELCIPYDDLAELEWLSTFVEDSFSSDDLQKLQLISGMQVRKADIIKEEEEFQEPENNRNNPIFAPDISVPGKARSKRSRAAPNNWSSRLLVLSPATSSSDSDIGGKKLIKAKVKSKEVCENLAGISDGRRCLHCATDKTPQWRTGPLGPKTLCNACGVRFKSGRLVPEYRPASSPTFVQAHHSNSHRKVMELRRQKEMHMSHHQQQRQYMHHNAMYNGSGGGAADDYLIHRHGGPDYRQLI